MKLPELTAIVTSMRTLGVSRLRTTEYEIELEPDNVWGSQNTYIDSQRPPRVEGEPGEEELPVESEKPETDIAPESIYDLAFPEGKPTW